MIRTSNILKCKWLAIFLVCAGLFSCDSDGGETQGNATLYSPTVEPKGSLSINAKAMFNVEVNGVPDSLSLTYVWTLKESRCTFMVESEHLGSQAETNIPSIEVRGTSEGDETIEVVVHDKDTYRVLARAELPFKVVPSTGLSNCFDNEPILFYRNNFKDTPAVYAMGLESDYFKISTPPKGWYSDISPDGNWFLRNVVCENQYCLWLESCDGSESRIIAQWPRIQYPVFSADGKSVYSTRYTTYTIDGKERHAEEIVKTDIASGNEEFLTNENIYFGHLATSPDGKWLAFIHSQETWNSNGSYTGSIKHLGVMPSNGGPIRFLSPIEGGNSIGGLDWSPDSKDIIYYFNDENTAEGAPKEGIYRVYIDGGGAPEFIYHNPKSGNRGKLGYYANGTRIAFQSQPIQGGTQFDIWSVDANGNDLKRLTDHQYNVFFSFIWEP